MPHVLTRAPAFCTKSALTVGHILLPTSSGRSHTLLILLSFTFTLWSRLALEQTVEYGLLPNIASDLQSVEAALLLSMHLQKSAGGGWCVKAHSLSCACGLNRRTSTLHMHASCASTQERHELARKLSLKFCPRPILRVCTCVAISTSLDSVSRSALAYVWQQGLFSWPPGFRLGETSWSRHCQLLAASQESS